MSIELLDQIAWEVSEHERTKGERDRAIDEKNRIAVLLSEKITELTDLKIEAQVNSRVFGEVLDLKNNLFSELAAQKEAIEASLQELEKENDRLRAIEYSVQIAHQLLDQMLYRSKPGAGLIDRLRYLAEVWQGIQAISNARFREMGVLQLELEKMQEENDDLRIVSDFWVANAIVMTEELDKAKALHNLEEASIDNELIPALIAWVETGSKTCRAIVEIWLKRRGLIDEFRFHQ